MSSFFASPNYIVGFEGINNFKLIVLSPGKKYVVAITNLYSPEIVILIQDYMQYFY